MRLQRISRETQGDVRVSKDPKLTHIRPYPLSSVSSVSFCYEPTHKILVKDVVCRTLSRLEIFMAASDDFFYFQGPQTSLLLRAILTKCKSLRAAGSS